MNFWFHIVNIGLLTSVLGFSLNLLLGYTGLVSLAHGAIYGIGGYAAAITGTQLGVPFPLTIVIAVLLAGLLSALTAWPALRVRGEYLILMTLAIQSVATGVFLAWIDVTGGVAGIGGIPRPQVLGFAIVTPPQFLPLIFVVFAISLAVSMWIGRSPFGRVLRSIRENESAALSVGKNVTYYKVAIFGISGLLAGLAGGTYAHYQAFVNPVSFNLDQSIFLVAVVVLGGVGNLVGTLVGAFLLAALPEVLRFLDVSGRLVGVVQLFLYGTLLVLFMLYRPQGLIPEHVRLLPRRRHPEHPRATDAAASETPARGDGAPPGEPALVAQGLTKRFGGVTPADDLSFTLLRGQVTALVGPNGAGKTTVFNLLTGYIPLDAGTVQLGSADITGLPPWRCVQHGLARTFQDVRLFEGLTVLDNVLVALPDQEGEQLTSLFAAPHRVLRTGRDNVERALGYLDFVGLRERADELVSSMAFGEQKLVSMARLMATGADVLLLDEPASGVDREWVRRILDLIGELAARGSTICIVEHNLDVVRAVAQRAYFMDQGKIVAEGTPAELMASEDLAVRYFGTARTRAQRSRAPEGEQRSRA